MKSIRFVKLKIQNFLSVGSEPVEVEFKQGTNIITGVNLDEEGIQNAVGKSTILCAFYFAIFGVTPNDIPKQYITNRKIGKNCKVTLEFEDISTRHGDEYFVIERTLQPNKVRVYKNDIDKTKSSIPETNKYIREVLSAEEELFLNCVILQANSTTPFMGKKKTDRKNFIESIFNLSMFGDMMKLLKDDLRNAKHDYDVERSAVTVLDGNIENYRRQIEKINDEIITRSKRLQEEQESIMSQINDEEKRLSDLKSKVVDVDTSSLEKIESAKKELSNNDQMLYGKLVEVKTTLKGKQNEKNKIAKMGNVCHACGRPYDEDTCNHNQQRIAELEQEETQFTAAIAAIENKRKEYAEKISKCESMRKTINDAISEANNTKQRIEYAEKAIAMYRKQLSDLPEKYKENNSISVFEDMLAAAEKDAKEKNEALAVIEKQIAKFNVCEYILGDMGVRSYIVNRLLDLLNGRIRYYLTAFKSTFTFTFNEFFEEEIKDATLTLCTYNNCSGAERKKIDLAISFAFKDVLKYHRQIEYNITFFDEILDSSVDSKSLEHITDFIAKQTEENGNCVYIITHKQDIAIRTVTETVRLEKKNGFTRRVYS